jgi:hypothetical protein
MLKKRALAHKDEGLAVLALSECKMCGKIYVAPTSCGTYSLGLFPWIIARVSFSFARFSLGAFILFNERFCGSAVGDESLSTFDLIIYYSQDFREHNMTMDGRRASAISGVEQIYPPAHAEHAHTIPWIHRHGLSRQLHR